MTSITNWLGALALAIILGTSHYLDYPSELEAAMAASKATADAQNQAQRQAQQRANFQRSAQRACGENAAFKLLDETTVQCFTKRGKRTHKEIL